MSRRPDVYVLLNAATEHGMQSEPDHEIGDLRTLVLACWDRLTAKQRKEVFDEAIADLGEWVVE